MVELVRLVGQIYASVVYFHVDLFEIRPLTRAVGTVSGIGVEHRSMTSTDQFTLTKLSSASLVESNVGPMGTEVPPGGYLSVQPDEKDLLLVEALTNGTQERRVGGYFLDIDDTLFGHIGATRGRVSSLPTTGGFPRPSHERGSHKTAPFGYALSMSTSALDFELENVAAGPNMFAFSEAASDPGTDTIVLLFQRDYHCRDCRQQVQEIAERYGDFEEVNASVVAILPEPADHAAEWHRQYDLPFPLLADPSKAVSETYDQPTRFGPLGSLHDLIGRMPLAVVFGVTDSEPTVMNTYEGKTPSDRPSINDLLVDVGTLGTA